MMIPALSYLPCDGVMCRGDSCPKQVEVRGISPRNTPRQNYYIASSLPLVRAELSPPCQPCVSQAPFFDEWASYGHAVIGAVTAHLPAAWQAAVAAGFIFYQLSETERLDAKIGDFAEFAVGFLGARAIA
jgi:hypothetical protein